MLVKLNDEIKDKVLNWLVAKSKGIELIVVNGGLAYPDGRAFEHDYANDRGEAALLAEENMIGVVPPWDGHSKSEVFKDMGWTAGNNLQRPSEYSVTGPTPAIAICRSFVMDSMQQYQVEVPDEVIEISQNKERIPVPRG